MKVILSHDVDNLTRVEHANDKIIIKMIIRGILEFLLFRIDFKTLKNRLRLIKDNNLNNIEALTDLDSKYNTKATYFFAVENDNTLAYKAEAAIPLVKMVKDKGLNAGIHGIAFENYDDMKAEYDKFSRLHGISDFGIRMHYLRRNENTLGHMKKAGYLFDTTEYSTDLKQPYISEEGIVEVPTHIMDSYLFQQGGLQKFKLDYAIKYTKDIIDKNMDRDIILVINFHQEYFSNGWKDWMDWYTWFVEYCYENKIEFIDYQEVIDELKCK